MKKYIVSLLGALLLLPLITMAERGERGDYNEKYRPQYHFSPQKGWIGDPDGLVYHNGLFHLYWWGHATSPDLVHWTEHPYPLKGGDGTFSYFSGSVAVDKENHAGFGRDAMLAFFTKHYPGDSLPETQAISISNDGGQSFHFYDKNPVLDIGEVFFRDPQVFWYEADKRWKMVVSRPDVEQIYIYESADLKQWDYCSKFGGLGAVGAFWECPDLFEVSTPGGTERKWVMLIGRGPNRVQYFVGDFDGKIFTPDPKTVEYLQRKVEKVAGVPDHALWLDYGADYYATRTWRNYDSNRNFADTVYSIGWMGNWDYARNSPSSWGKGFESLPRTIFLENTPEGYRLIQLPVPQLQQLRGEKYSLKRKKINGAMECFATQENVYEMVVEFSHRTAEMFGVELLKGEGRSLVVSYSPQQALLTVDRTNCTDFVSDVEFSAKFATVMKAPVEMVDGRLKLHIFVDRSSVEIFVNDGRTVMSVTTFPSDAQTGIELFSRGGTTELRMFDAWKMRSIWSKN